MKTLFMASQVPWPPDTGSKIRAVNLLRCYAEISEVTLICFAHDDAEARNVAQLERYCRRVLCLPLSRDDRNGEIRGRRLRAVARMINLLPSAVQYFRSAELAERIGALANAERFDIVHVGRLSMSQYVGCAVPGVRTSARVLCVLDVDDVESVKMKRIAALDSWVSRRKYLELLEWLKLYLYERRSLAWFDWALVCSEKDRRNLQIRCRSATIWTFSNGADCREGDERATDKDDGRTLVYFGSMSYFPNEDAAAFFVESVLPLIKRQIPSVRLIIAGGEPSARVLALQNGTDVQVAGYVSDKVQLLDSCTVFIVPLRTGGGTRIKILEAMAFGKPIVSTSVGCEGIEVTPGNDILVADTAVEFAAACVRLLRDKPLREAIAHRGMSLVLRSYRWDEIRRQYIHAVEEWASGTSHEAVHSSSPSRSALPNMSP